MANQEEPSQQIQLALIHEMRLRPPCGIDPQQIRAKLDTSGELKGFCGITVSVSDLGGHNGLPGRVLIDVRVRVTIWTHVDEDHDGSLCDNLSSEARKLLPMLNENGNDWTLPPLDGWAVRFPGVIQTGEPELSDDGAYRVKELSTTMFLQNKHLE